MRFTISHLTVVQDPAELTVIDMTALGIVEMTRKKARKPLAEQLRVL